MRAWRGLLHLKKLPAPNPSRSRAAVAWTGPRHGTSINIGHYKQEAEAGFGPLLPGLR